MTRPTTLAPAACALRRALPLALLVLGGCPTARAVAPDAAIDAAPPDASLDCTWGEWSGCSCTPTECAGCFGVQQQTDDCGRTRQIACVPAPLGCDNVCCGGECCAAGLGCGADLAPGTVRCCSGAWGTPAADVCAHAAGTDLPLSFATDLPDALDDVSVYVIRRGEPTARSRRFGASGARGDWDLETADFLNGYYGTARTGRQYLEKHLALLALAGVEWTQLDVFWGEIEDPEGVFHFEALDETFEVARANRLRLVVTLVGVPPWSSDACPGRNAATPAYTTPSDLTSAGSPAYDRIATALVERYRPFGVKDPTSGYGVRTWQIWDEPDSAAWTDCATGATGDLHAYVHLMGSAYGAIKAADPDATVLMGGLTGVQPAARLDAIYDHLLYNSFDVIDVHYTGPAAGFTAELQAVLDLRAIHGDAEKAVWVTETGTLDRAAQPAYLTSVFGQMEALFASGLFNGLWWDSRGTFFSASDPDPRERQAALFDANFAPHPVYFELGAWLGTATLVGTLPVTVTGGAVATTVPGAWLAAPGDYAVFHASESEVVTDLPVLVRVPAP